MAWFLESPRGVNLAKVNALILDFWPSKLWEGKFPLFSTLSLCSLVLVVLGNYYSSHNNMLHSLPTTGSIIVQRPQLLLWYPLGICSKAMFPIGCSLPVTKCRIKFLRGTDHFLGQFDSKTLSQPCYTIFRLNTVWDALILPSFPLFFWNKSASWSDGLLTFPNSLPNFCRKCLPNKTHIY